MSRCDIPDSRNTSKEFYPNFLPLLLDKLGSSSLHVKKALTLRHAVDSFIFFYTLERMRGTTVQLLGTCEGSRRVCIQESHPVSEYSAWNLHTSCFEEEEILESAFTESRGLVELEEYEEE